MLLSIIIPAFNAANNITRAINSITSQSFTDLEILLIDDGSTDDTLQIANHLATLDSRIKVFHQENQGAAAARNVGLTNMTGKYFTFVDSDDIILNNIYEVALSILEIHSDVDIVTYTYQFYLNGQLNHYTLETETPSSQIVYNTIAYDDIHYGGGYIWNRVYRNDGYYSKHPIMFQPKFSRYEDKIWLLDLLLYPTTLQTIPNIGYEYTYPLEKFFDSQILGELDGLHYIYSNYKFNDKTSLLTMCKYARTLADSLFLQTKGLNTGLLKQLQRIYASETAEMQEYINYFYSQYQEF